MLDKSSLNFGLGLRPSLGGGAGEGDGAPASPFANLAKGASGVKSKSKSSGKKGGLFSGDVLLSGLGSHPLSPDQERGGKRGDKKRGKGGYNKGGKGGSKGGKGSSAGDSMGFMGDLGGELSAGSVVGLTIGGKVIGLGGFDGSQPKVEYTREFILQYAEHNTQLPTDLEGTTFEVVLQPGDTESREAQIAAMHNKAGGSEDSGAAGEEQDWTKKAFGSQGQGGKTQPGDKSGKSANWSKDKVAEGGKRQGQGGGKKAGGAMNGGAAAMGGKGSTKIVKASDVGLTAWAPTKASSQSDTERVLRQVRGILNKLTPENFERLFSKLVESIATADILSGSISMLFEKAVAEPMFCSLNAELCLRLSKELPEFPAAGEDTKPMTFRRVLLNTCQEEFEGSLMGLSQEDGSEMDDENSKAKRRMLGNVKLIGHLCTRKVINQKIVHVCIQQLLSGNIPGTSGTSVHENCIECACELLSLTAKSLGETPQAVPLVESYFGKLDDISAEPQLSSRVRFIIKDVQELRRAKWVPRKEAITQKTISEIHAEAQAELGITVLPDSLAKSFAPLSGMVTKADEVQDLLPSLRGGDSGWEISAGKKSESNIIDGSKYSALVGEAPPVPTREDKKAGDSASTSGKTFTPEEMEKKTKSLITEYMSSADVAEALLCVKELNSQDFMPKLVEIIISTLLDNVTPTGKDLLIKLLVSLRKEDAISEGDLSKGLHVHTDLLDDLAIDVPLAPKLIGDAVAACIKEGVAPAALGQELHDAIDSEDDYVKEKFRSVLGI